MSITREQRFEIGTSINEKYRIYGNAANQVLRSESDDDANI